MPTRDLRVTVVLDYTIQWDDDTEEPDLDYIHDAIVDNFDTVDLEQTTNHPMYDEDGDETDETFEISMNCDNVREIEVTDVTEGGRG